MSFNPMLWAISTAFVLQGEIISLRGPMKMPFAVLTFNGFAPLNSQVSFWMSRSERLFMLCTAKSWELPFLKKVIIADLRCVLILCCKITQYFQIKKVLSTFAFSK